MLYYDFNPVPPPQSVCVSITVIRHANVMCCYQIVHVFCFMYIKVNYAYLALKELVLCYVFDLQILLPEGVDVDRLLPRSK